MTEKNNGKTQIQLEKEEKAIVKSLAVQKLKELSGDSPWTIPQRILQEIIATLKIENKKIPAITKLRLELINEVGRRYKSEEAIRDLILEAIPSEISISKWMKKEGWDEAVWEQCKVDGLFTAEKRAKVIQALYDRATGWGGKEKPDPTSAKLYLTMTGDYTEKVDINKSDLMDQFREIQNALQKGK